MALNSFEKRIKEWEQKYRPLSRDVLRKINKLVEQYDKTQKVEKESNVLSIADGTKLKIPTHEMSLSKQTLRLQYEPATPLQREQSAWGMSCYIHNYPPANWQRHNFSNLQFAVTPRL